jgi:hypothetical protein
MERDGGFKAVRGGGGFEGVDWLMLMGADAFALFIGLNPWPSFDRFLRPVFRVERPSYKPPSLPHAAPNPLDPGERTGRI